MDVEVFFVVIKGPELQVFFSERIPFCGTVTLLVYDGPEVVRLLEQGEHPVPFVVDRGVGNRELLIGSNNFHYKNIILQINKH